MKHSRNNIGKVPPGLNFAGTNFILNCFGHLVLFVVYQIKLKKERTFDIVVCTNNRVFNSDFGEGGGTVPPLWGGGLKGGE